MASDKQSGVRKADRVADDLLQRIVSGNLDAGSFLPKEAELATHYGVNRSVIREAIKLLEVHRLVRPVRRRGTEVLDPMASISPEVLRAMIMPASGGVDRHVFASLLEIRSSLDIQMTCLAAERRTDADLVLLDEILDKLRDALGDRERYQELLMLLTRTVARSSQNPIFEMLSAWNQMVTSELASIFEAIRPANEPHWQGIKLMIELIRQQEVEAVRSLVQAFHDWATPRLMAAAALSSGQSLSELIEEFK